MVFLYGSRFGRSNGIAGRTVAAPIVAARHSEGKGGGDFISYHYGATSEDVGEVRIPLDTQESLSVGKMLPVKMLGTGHFVRVPLFDGQPGRALYGNWFITVAYGLILLLGAQTEFFDARRRRELLRTGSVTKGEVTRVSQGGKRGFYTVNYVFSVANRQIKDWRHGLQNNPKMKAGDLITVLFDPANPDKNTVYELCESEVDTRHS